MNRTWMIPESCGREYRRDRGGFLWKCGQNRAENPFAVRCVEAASSITRCHQVHLSDTMYLSISFGKSAPTQNRQLNILISNSQQEVDDFVGELTFWLINTFCEIRMRSHWPRLFITSFAFRVSGLGFRISGPGFKINVKGWGFKACGLGSRAYGLWLRTYGSGLKVGDAFMV